MLFIILGGHIFSDTVLGSCVAVLCNSVELPVCDPQQTQLVSVISFCCELHHCCLLIYGEVHDRERNKSRIL